jgi:hypothetical protein
MYYCIMIDSVKQEEPWGDTNEKYIRELINTCKLKIDQHDLSGYHFKKKNAQWGLPAALIPTIMAPVSVLIDSYPEVSKYINASAFITTSVIIGVSSFYRYGEQTSNHFNISARYSDILSDIELELVKGRKFRTQIDVFLTRIHMNLDSLANTAPIIPRFILDIPINTNYKHKVVLNINDEI